MSAPDGTAVSLGERGTYMAWWGKKTEKRLFDGLEPGYRKLFGPGKKLKPKKGSGGGKPKKGKK